MSSILSRNALWFQLISIYECSYVLIPPWHEKSFSGLIIQKSRIKLWNIYSGYNTRFFLNGLGLEAVSCNCSETDVCNLFYDTLLFHGQRRSFYYSAKITTSNYEFIFLKKSSLFFHLFCIFQCSLTSWYQFCPEQSKNFISIQNRGSSVWFLSVFFTFCFCFLPKKIMYITCRGQNGLNLA